MANGAPHSAEALVRRALPDGRLVPPAEFVPHVERTPVVRELTYLVVADALDAARRWAVAGHHLGVSINIPYRLLDDSQFADGLTETLRTVDPTSPQVTLEVVPSGPGAGTEVDEEILARFDALGVRLSLDDAGRAASFAALRVLPLDEIKIDVGFVHGLGKNATDAALVRGMIDIGHALGLRVVAEGVETRHAWAALAEWGCDYAQGFYVASPRTADELIDWLGASWPAVA
jgi:EAL domain-containing protein (putative c-di-GMP-specific phosphodiesterase class I)